MLRYVGKNQIHLGPLHAGPLRFGRAGPLSGVGGADPLRAGHTHPLLCGRAVQLSGAGGADLYAVSHVFAQYGAALGAAFQIRDDMLDVLSTEAELGKPIGSDEAEGKVTFMSLYGEEKCASMVGSS